MSEPAELIHPNGRTTVVQPVDGQRFTTQELEGLVGLGCEIRRGPAGYVIVCKFGDDRPPNQGMPGFRGPVVILPSSAMLHQLPRDF